MGTRSKGGYECLYNKLYAVQNRKEQPFLVPPKRQVISKYRKRTRKFRKINRS